MRMLYWPLRSPLSASKRFEGKDQIFEAGGRFQNSKALFRLATESLEFPDAFTFAEVFRPLIAVA